MKVAILGGGVIGVTSAYYLSKAGHEVVLVDRQPGPALETSFANAGEVSFGYSSPWAGPGIPVKAIKWLIMRHGPLVVRPILDPMMWFWIARMLRNCTSARYRLNKSRMVAIAEYARTCIAELRAETGIAYDERMKGTLQLFRRQAQLDHVGSDIEVLKQYGIAYEVLDPAGCIAAEPALAAVKGKFVGGLRLPGDETGDCHIFTNRLADICRTRGVDFRFGTTIDGISLDNGKITGVSTSAGPMKADAYVVALGSHAPKLLRTVGLSVPIYPVKGYSLTFAVSDPAAAPVSTIMDESYKVAITRLGDRIRVGGTAELSGFDTTLYPARRATLEHSVTDLFPGGGDAASATFWSGLRPMTPDGPPVVGKTRIDNLFINGGHGTLGWTMSCGSGRFLADVISGRKPAIDPAPLNLERYRGLV